jgi:hypothetical protein
MQKPPVRFLPRGKLRFILGPVNERSLIAPFQQLPHRGPMRGRHHERPHLNLRIPTSRRPERIPLIAQHGRRKIPFRALGLSHNSQRSKQESRQVRPRSNPQARDGDDGHKLFFCLDGNTRSGDPPGTAVQEILSPGRQILQINSKLLAFLIQMTSLKAECLRGLRYMSVILFEFSPHGLSLESKHPLCQRSGRLRGIAASAGGLRVRVRRRQRQIDIRGAHFSVRKQQ